MWKAANAAAPQRSAGRALAGSGRDCSDARRLAGLLVEPGLQQLSRAGGRAIARTVLVARPDGLVAVPTQHAAVHLVGAVADHTDAAFRQVAQQLLGGVGAASLAMARGVAPLGRDHRVRRGEAAEALVPAGG